MRKGLKAIIAGGLVASLLTVGAVVAQDAMDWDANNDGALGAEEWNEGFAEQGFFDDWDADGDGLLSEDEFNEGVFGAYDENENEILEHDEYQAFQDDVGDAGFWDV